MRTVSVGQALFYLLAIFRPFPVGFIDPHEMLILVVRKVGARTRLSAMQMPYAVDHFAFCFPFFQGSTLLEHSHSLTRTTVNVHSIVHYLLAHKKLLCKIRFQSVFSGQNYRLRWGKERMDFPWSSSGTGERNKRIGCCGHKRKRSLPSVRSKRIPHCLKSCLAKHWFRSGCKLD